MELPHAIPDASYYDPPDPPEPETWDETDERPCCKVHGLWTPDEAYERTLDPDDYCVCPKCGHTPSAYSAPDKARANNVGQVFRLSVDTGLWPPHTTAYTPGEVDAGLTAAKLGDEETALLFAQALARIAWIEKQGGDEG